MKSNYEAVKWFILSTLALWLVFDAWLGPHGGPTESQVLQYWAKRYVSVAWLIGALVGHWCFGLQTAHYKLWPIGFLVLAALVGWDVAWNVNPVEPFHPWFRWPALWAIAGIACGLLFWPQRNPDAPF